jgi:membrane protease subunit HflK
MYLDTVQQIMSSSNKVMVDARAGGNLLYLPLDKLMQMSAAGTAPSGAASRPAQAETPPAFEPSSRSRDALRSRDRDVRP